MTDNVKLRLRFKVGSVEVAGEGLWASPVDAHDGGGTYSLLNNSFYAAIGVGDLVRAEVDGDGLLQITDIVMPAPVVVSAFAVSPHLSSDSACAMGDGWRDHGANWSEGTSRMLVTIWDAGVDELTVQATLRRDERAGRGHIVDVLAPESRTREAQDVVDFELDRTQHVAPTRTAYWAAEDPYWREHGLDSPDFLAFVQGFIAFDAEAARYLERGEHQKVLDMITFVNGEDPRGT